MHSTLLFVVLAILASAVAVNGQTSICPSVGPMQTYDGLKAMGTWYVIAYSACTVAMPNVKCEYINFNLNDDGTADLKTTATDLKTNSMITNDGTITADKDIPAKFYQKDGNTTYIVVDTDYDKYAVVMAYLTVNGIPGSILSIISQDKEITDANAVEKYKQAMREAGLDPDELQQMSQNDCSTD